MIDALKKEGCILPLVLPVSLRDHLKGCQVATVTLLEYGDYECSHCVRAFEVVWDAVRWLNGALCFVFRHFPATEKHPRALLAAEAAEAAGSQGKFWEMHNSLYEHSPALDEAHLVRYAQELGLGMERFECEMREHVYLARVREDVESGIESGVHETPAFFINGGRYQGECDLDSLLAAIEEAGTLRPEEP